MAKSRLDKMVDDFSEQMKTRLREKSREGWSGWDESPFDEKQVTRRIRLQVIDSCIFSRLNQDAFRHIDPIDLANYCAFLYLKRGDK